MEPRLNIVTLCVKDLALARGFYGRLGWREFSASTDGIAFFDLGGVIFGLYGFDEFVKELGIEGITPAPCAMSLAYNTRSETEVDEALAKAVEAGARLIKPAQKVFWGGYSGYFADLDGHLWEVAYNPFVGIDENGKLNMPPPEAM